MPLVAFLRGVNVGGHRTFRPSELARALSHLDAVNIGAAGNFVIKKPISPAKLRAELQKNLPFETEIMICTGKELMEIAGDPFSRGISQPGIVRFVSVLSKPLKTRPKLPLVLNPGDPWLIKIIAIRGRFALGMYVRTPKVIRYFCHVEKRLGVSATTRNWNTINAIVKVLKAN